MKKLTILGLIVAAHLTTSVVFAQTTRPKPPLPPLPPGLVIDENGKITQVIPPKNNSIARNSGDAASEANAKEGAGAIIKEAAGAQPQQKLDASSSEAKPAAQSNEVAPAKSAAPK